MADNQTSLNENLIAAGLNPNNPSQTYVDFGNQIARARTDQEQQEQALELAKQHVAQAQLQTKQANEADAAGVNPLMQDVMTPEQARQYLLLILKEKGLTIDPADINNWIATLKGPINRNVVETFANRFARATTRSGQPAQFATTDKIEIPEGSTAKDLGLVEDANDPSVGHVPEDGMYQVVYDNEGNIKKFIPGGKEPVDPTAKNAGKAADTANKRWTELGKQIDTAFRTRSGGLGSLSTAIWRATRAINVLKNSPDLSAQDLENVAADVAGIFQGGAPTAETMKGNNYDLAILNAENAFRGLTGVGGFLHKTFGAQHVDNILQDTKNKLLETLEGLRASCVASLQSYIESQKPSFEDIINADPDHWERMKTEKMNLAVSGLLGPDGKPLLPSDAMTQLKVGTGMKTSGNATPTADNKSTPPAGNKGNDKNPLNLKGL